MALESDLDWGWLEVGDAEGYLYVNDRRKLGNHFECSEGAEKGCCAATRLNERDLPGMTRCTFSEENKFTLKDLRFWYALGHTKSSGKSSFVVRKPQPRDVYFTAETEVQMFQYWQKWHEKEFDGIKIAQRESTDSLKALLDESIPSDRESSRWLLQVQQHAKLSWNTDNRLLRRRKVISGWICKVLVWWVVWRWWFKCLKEVLVTRV